MIHVNGAGFCDDQIPVLSTIGRGPKGAQGSQGLVGPKGDQGPKGDKGDQGPKGDKGDTVFASFASPIEWNASTSYPDHTVVIHDGDSYISRISVPANIDISDTNYWLKTGNYNAQLEQIRDQLEKSPMVFSTVSDMLSSANLYVGAVCKTLGFYQENDGVSNYYYISDFGVEDAMSVFKIGNLYAHLLITEPYITPDMLGAVGDGAADDTAYVEKAIYLSTYAYTRNVLIVNSYLVTRTITIEDGSTYIIGLTNGNAESTIFYEGDGVCFNVTNSSFIMKDVRIYGNFGDTACISYNIIQYSPTQNANTDSEITNCKFLNLNKAIVVRGRNVHIKGCVFSQCTYGVVIEQNTSGSLECRNTFITDCIFHTIGYDVAFDDSKCACISTDVPALDEYTPYDIVISNNRVQFSGCFYNGSGYVDIFDNNIFAPRSSYSIIQLQNPTRGNQRNHVAHIFNNHVYADQFADVVLTRFLVIRNIVLCIVENNVVDNACSAEAVFVTNSGGISIINNNFGFNTQALTAQSTAYGVCKNNGTFVNATYTGGSMTLDGNYVVVINA